jgi:hypothetical protein
MAPSPARPLDDVGVLELLDRALGCRGCRSRHRLDMGDVHRRLVEQGGGATVVPPTRDATAGGRALNQHREVDALHEGGGVCGLTARLPIHT